jgi:hypothetical protein
MYILLNVLRGFYVQSTYVARPYAFVQMLFCAVEVVAVRFDNCCCSLLVVQTLSHHVFQAAHIL